MEPQKHQSSTSKYCHNCYHPIDVHQSYCAYCGQKNTDGRVTVGSLLQELFSAVFNLDSKIFRTLRDLCAPGKLTLEYFKGKHRRYIHPIRLFLVTALLLITAISFYGENVLEVGNTGFSKDVIEQELAQKEMLQNLRHLSDSIQQIAAHPSVAQALDTLRSKMQAHSSSIKDSISLGKMTRNKDNVALEGMIKMTNISIAKTDYASLAEEELMEKYQIKGFWERWFFSQQLQIITDTAAFIRFYIKNFLWTMFLMMPFLALIFKVYFFRRKMYYVEHLIFSFHAHAFIFLLLTLAIIVGNFTNITDFAIVLCFLALGATYVFWSIKRVYPSGWIRAIFSFWIITLTYTFLFCFFLLLSLIVGMVVF